MGILDSLFGSSQATTTVTPTFAPQLQDLADRVGGLSALLMSRPQVPYLGRRRAPLSPMLQAYIGRGMEVGTAPERAYSGPRWDPRFRQPQRGALGQAGAGTAPINAANGGRMSMSRMPPRGIPYSTPYGYPDPRSRGALSQTMR